MCYIAVFRLDKAAEKRKQGPEYARFSLQEGQIEIRQHPATTLMIIHHVVNTGIYTMFDIIFPKKKA